MRDAGTAFTNLRTGIVDLDEQSTLSEVGRYPVQCSSSNSEADPKPIDEGNMVNGVESGTQVKGEKNSGFTIVYCGEAATSVKRSEVSVE